MTLITTADQDGLLLAVRDREAGGLKDEYDSAFGNDTDSDRMGS